MLAITTRLSNDELIGIIFKCNSAALEARLFSPYQDG